MLSHAETLECLSLEREAEKQESLSLHEAMGLQALQQSGLALHRLRVASVESALFGRTLVVLQLTAKRPLPPTKLTAGAMVAMRPAAAPAASALTGTVTALREAEIHVAFDDLPEEEQLAEPLVLSLMYNDVTYRRLERTLTALRDDKVPSSAAVLVPCPTRRERAGRRRRRSGSSPSRSTSCTTRG